MFCPAPQTNIVYHDGLTKTQAVAINSDSTHADAAAGLGSSGSRGSTKSMPRLS